MWSLKVISAFAGVVRATITITDPSDFVGTEAWSADNALLADYTVMPTSYHTLPYKATLYYDGVNGVLDHIVSSQTANDSSVIIFTSSSKSSITNSRIIKSGYNSNLIEASFFGINAAVWVGNGSTATIDGSNVTVHNGAANIYAYGTGTEVQVSNTQLYSSGPVSHGLYASGNGTIYGSNLKHYSGGYRSSSFSGDSPAGYIHVSDSVAHTEGVGSAICYALGLCNITSTIGHTSKAPAMFMDGIQEAIWTDCDLTAGLLAGMIVFSSQSRETGATLSLIDTKLTVLGKTMPGLFFGNTIASAAITRSILNVTASGVLVAANFSQVTQDFDYFASYSDNPNLQPAIVTINVTESALNGDLVAYNGSTITWNLGAYSSWLGKGYSGYEISYLEVNLDSTSNWTLTGPTTLQSFTDADSSLANIFTNGHDIYYNASISTNSWLKGATHSLNGGGKLVPDNGARVAHAYWGGYGMQHQKTPASTYSYPVPTWVY